MPSSNPASPTSSNSPASLHIASNPTSPLQQSPTTDNSTASGWVRPPFALGELNRGKKRGHYAWKPVDDRHAVWMKQNAPLGYKARHLLEWAREFNLPFHESSTANLLKKLHRMDSHPEEFGPALKPEGVPDNYAFPPVPPSQYTRAQGQWLKAAFEKASRQHHDQMTAGAAGRMVRPTMLSEKAFVDFVEAAVKDPTEKHLGVTSPQAIHFYWWRTADANRSARERLARESAITAALNQQRRAAAQAEAAFNTAFMRPVERQEPSTQPPSGWQIASPRAHAMPSSSFERIEPPALGEANLEHRKLVPRPALPGSLEWLRGLNRDEQPAGRRFMVYTAPLTTFDRLEPPANLPLDLVRNAPSATPSQSASSISTQPANSVETVTGTAFQLQEHARRPFFIVSSTPMIVVSGHLPGEAAPHATEAEVAEPTVPTIKAERNKRKRTTPQRISPEVQPHASTAAGATAATQRLRDQIAALPEVEVKLEPMDTSYDRFDQQHPDYQQPGAASQSHFI